MEPVQSSARLTFWEAASIIIGHGIGAGILSVPYLASRNSWWDILWIAAVAYLINLLLHFMIAELSYNNGGAQFIRCFEKELFVGRIGKILTWIAFALLGFSTIVNVSGFITGAAAALTAWLGLPELAAMLLFYIVSAAIVYLGLKVVGVCEKIAVFSMVGVVGILLAATLLSELSPLSTDSIAFTNLLALYSMVAFSLSAVMSTPQVVKGLQGDVKQIRRAIAAGTGLNLLLILVITFMTLLGAGRDISQNGALVDLAAHLGGWVSVIGYIFTLLAGALGAAVELADRLPALPCDRSSAFHQLCGLYPTGQRGTGPYRRGDYRCLSPLPPEGRGKPDLRPLRDTAVPDPCHRGYPALHSGSPAAGKVR